MKLSIIIVNYKVKFFLEQCLIAVQKATKNIDSEIIVVDNFSNDDSVSYLSERFPTVHYIENLENRGFAKANNQAIRIAHGEYILLLNPDTVVGESTLVEVCSFMDCTPDAGGVGVKMIDGDGEFLPESKRGFPTLWASFSKIFGLNYLFPYSRFFGRYHLRYLSKEEIHVVDVLSGAFCLLRKKTLDVCGLLDEDYFMYGEDIDLSYRITKTGMKNYYLPVPIIHYKGESTKTESIAYVKVFYNAMLIFFEKHYTHYKGVYYLAVKGAITFRAILSMAKRAVNPLSAFYPKKRNTSISYYYIIGKSDSSINKVMNLPKEAVVKIASCISTINFSELKNSRKHQIHIIFDNTQLSYSNIMSNMEKYSQPGVYFYIYSTESGNVISPNETFVKCKNTCLTPTYA